MTNDEQNDGPRHAVVGQDQHNATLAAVVRALMNELSWNKSRELVRTGRVAVDGAMVFDPAIRLAKGAVVDINPTGKRRSAAMLEPERLIHVDPEIAVVNKPAFLLSVPYGDDDERDTLIERTRVALIERERGQGSTKLLAVQRLDKDTTGLLVFARTRRSRKALEIQFRAHTIHRRYVALVHGRAEGAVYDNFLIPDRGDGLRGSWRGSKPPTEAKRAITKVRVEERMRGPTGDLTLVSCQIETGKQHQIRIHLSEAGNPLVGEQVYGRRRDRDRSVELNATLGADRPMLHAASLGFRHPTNERPMRFEMPLPDDFRALLDRLRGS